MGGNTSKEKKQGSSASNVTGNDSSPAIGVSSTQEPEGERLESVVEEKKAGEQGQVEAAAEGGEGEKKGEEGYGSTIDPPPALAEGGVDAELRSGSGYSSAVSHGKDELTLRSDTSGSESGFLSDNEFSTESELSSDDSLFEYEIDQPQSGTLKMKPKDGVDVVSLKHKRSQRRSERRKQRRHHPGIGSVEEEGKEVGGDDEGVEEVDWPWSKKKEKRHKFHKLQRELQTGDLCIMYRAKSHEPQFGIFVDYKECNSHFPLLLLKGRSKFMSLAEFARQRAGPKCREVRLVSASSRIFYGDHNRVYVRKLKRGDSDAANCRRMDRIVQMIESTPFTEEEVTEIETEIKGMTQTGFQALSREDSIRPHSRLLKTPSALVVAYAYKELGYLKGDPRSARTDSLEDMLELGPRLRVKVPKPRWGPVQKGDPPLLARVIDDFMEAPQSSKPVSLGSLIGDLETGDIVLMSGMSLSGSIIRLFDQSEFSHVALVFKADYINQVMVFEASTNKAGLVDIETGRVTQGVELLPLEVKIFSGWYGRVAVRRLTGLSPERREEIGKKLMEFYDEVSGRPYEQNKMDLILSSLKFIEDALPFLKNRKEDLSSLFCSELVAAAYHHMGLLTRDRPSHSFTPDDFSTNRSFELLEGTLSEHIYIDLREACEFQGHYDDAMKTPDPS